MSQSDLRNCNFYKNHYYYCYCYCYCCWYIFLLLTGKHVFIFDTHNELETGTAEQLLVRFTVRSISPFNHRCTRSDFKVSAKFKKQCALKNIYQARRFALGVFMDAVHIPTLSKHLALSPCTQFSWNVYKSRDNWRGCLVCRVALPVYVGLVGAQTSYYFLISATSSPQPAVLIGCQQN